MLKKVHALVWPICFDSTKKLHQQHGNQYDIQSFLTEVSTHYSQVDAPKLSKWKIALSLASLGLFLVINFIIARIKTRLAAEAYHRVSSLKNSFAREKAEAENSHLSTKQLTQTYTQEHPLLAKCYYSWFAEVPFKSVVV